MKLVVNGLVVDRDFGGKDEFSVSFGMCIRGMRWFDSVVFEGFEVVNSCYSGEE